MARQSRAEQFLRKIKDGTAKEPTEGELNSIRNDPDCVVELRSRLSYISSWVRLMSADC